MSLPDENTLADMFTRMSSADGSLFLRFAKCSSGLGKYSYRPAVGMVGIVQMSSQIVTPIDFPRILTRPKSEPGSKILASLSAP